VPPYNLTVRVLEEEGGGVFFSEYVEGSSNNKAVEIYNGQNAEVDLTGCEVMVFANGAAAATSSIALASDAGALVLAAGGTFVLCNARSGEALAPLCDQLHGGLSFNGDDAVSLVCDGATLDVIGQIGNDPGSAWGNADISTQNRTIRRQCDIILGDDDGGNAFEPAEEWNNHDQDTFDDLGSHCERGAGATFEVAIEGFDMAPTRLAISVGDTVQWTNNDGAIHTVTSGDPGDANAGGLFDSGNMRNGEVFEHTFNEAGEFRYFCRPHQGFMSGYTVVVQ